MIIRPNYLEKIKSFIDIKLVKILLGIRRCGKSMILEMLKKELLSRGIDESHIIQKNYSSKLFGKSFSYKEMYEEFKSSIVDNQRYYFLLDEFQEIDGWEKVIKTLLESYNSDIYVTGSNSKLMSSEISSYLTGRYVTIPVYTLSFKEYLLFKNNLNK